MVQSCVADLGKCMTSPPFFRLLVFAALAACAAAALARPAAPATASHRTTSCWSGYSYDGVQGSSRTYGVGAHPATADPQVHQGSAMHLLINTGGGDVLGKDLSVDWREIVEGGADIGDVSSLGDAAIIVGLLHIDGGFANFGTLGKRLLLGKFQVGLGQ